MSLTDEQEQELREAMLTRRTSDAGVVAESSRPVTCPWVAGRLTGSTWKRTLGFERSLGHSERPTECPRRPLSGAGPTRAVAMRHGTDTRRGDPQFTVRALLHGS
jgi:hypothetical protein